MSVATLKEDMEEGQLSSEGEEAGQGGEVLGGYTPLERPTNPKPNAQPQRDTQDYSSDSEDGCGIGAQDSDSDEDKPVPKAMKRTQGPSHSHQRRGALVIEDGGGEIFQAMAMAYQADRESKGLNKKKKNNVWGNIVQEESIASSIEGFGVGRQLKDLASDRGAETYDYTLIAKERREERKKQWQETKDTRLLEKEKQENSLDDEMDSYWSRKDPPQAKEDSDEETKENGAEAMQEDAEDNDIKRGTKRSVKERLGDKKVKLDRFKNETLPPPGEPRQIVDIAEISLVEGTDEEFGEEVAERLKEDKEEMIVTLVKTVGRKVVMDFFKETQKIERKGGMVINNGARRRTPGGVLLHLLRKTEDAQIKDKVKQFFATSQKDDRRKILAAKKKQKKDFDKEMADFLSARKELSKKKADTDDGKMDVGEGVAEVQSESEEEKEELAPLPNVLSMIAHSMKAEGGGEAQQGKPKESGHNTTTSGKPKVERASSFKEPRAPPNSVERSERLSPISKEDRALLDYEDDDFLTTTNDTEDIELF